MPLGPCLQSLCPLCNAHSYLHPCSCPHRHWNVAGSTLGAGCGEGGCCEEPIPLLQAGGSGCIGHKTQITRARLGSSCRQGADAPWGSCHLCPGLWRACSGRGCWSDSQTWRTSGEDWQQTRGSRVSPVLLAPFLFAPFLYTQLSQEMASSPPTENLPTFLLPHFDPLSFAGEQKVIPLEKFSPIPFFS